MYKTQPISRNGIISKIHIAKSQLALDDASYRAILQRVAGKDSCKDLTVAQLEDVLQEFTRLGFKKPPVKRAGPRKLADTAQAAKIRALWLDLYHLNAVRDPSEDALLAFVKNIAMVDALQWLQYHQANRVTDALRGWLKRNGYIEPSSAWVTGFRAFRHEMLGNERIPAMHIKGLAAKAVLIRLQITKLGIDEAEAMRRIKAHGLGEYAHIDLIDRAVFDPAIEYFGAEVRRAGSR